MGDFERREGVDVDAGRALRFTAAAEFEIGLAGVARMDAALQADFGGAACGGFARAAGDFAMVEIVAACRAERRRRVAFGERAEAAFVEADIGVIDVAVDDIAHRRRRTPLCAERRLRRTRVPYRRRERRTEWRFRSRSAPAVSGASERALHPARSTSRPGARWPHARLGFAAGAPGIVTRQAFGIAGWRTRGARLGSSQRARSCA